MALLNDTLDLNPLRDTIALLTAIGYDRSSDEATRWLDTNPLTYHREDDYEQHE